MCWKMGPLEGCTSGHPHIMRFLAYIPLPVNFSHTYSTLTRKFLSSKAPINHACVDIGRSFPLAHLFHFFCRGSWAIVQVGAICLDHRVLSVEEQLSLGHSCSPHTGPDGESVVVLWVAVEISAMAILAWLRRHGDFNVDVITLARLIPPVDLQCHIQRKSHMNDVELLAITASLQLFSVAVVSGLNWGVGITPLRWEALEDGLSVPSSCECRDPELMPIQEGTANDDLFGCTETMGDGSGEIPALNVDRLALHNPILTL